MFQIRIKIECDHVTNSQMITAALSLKKEKCREREREREFSGIPIMLTGRMQMLQVTFCSRKACFLRYDYRALKPYCGFDRRSVRECWHFNRGVVGFTCYPLYAQTQNPKQ